MCDELIIAEDNPSILKRYCKYLEKYDIKYKSFLNGQTCFDYVSNIQCNLCSKILLITDLSMPYKDGIELSKDVNALGKKQEIITILISAEEYSNDDNLFKEV